MSKIEKLVILLMIYSSEEIKWKDRNRSCWVFCLLVWWTSKKTTPILSETKASGFCITLNNGCLRSITSHLCLRGLSHSGEELDSQGSGRLWSRPAGRPITQGCSFAHSAPHLAPPADFPGISTDQCGWGTVITHRLLALTPLEAETLPVCDFRKEASLPPPPPSLPSSSYLYLKWGERLEAFNCEP